MKSITIDKEVLSGVPVFYGTRVPVESLFQHLEAGDSLDIFLEDFPTVSKSQAIAVLEMSAKSFLSNYSLVNEDIN